jgi:ABC-type polysaccharide/polyol phosphate transport system ATPase subunit
LSKSYRLFAHPADRVKQFLSMGLRRYHQDFEALHELDFEVRHGESIGIIGRNGSGKSTLLQLICGILKPTAGTLKASGRIAALLELGSGFNPEFTGRENVYFQGALMGMSRQETDSRVDDIIAFADIGDFIDQPVRMYSSGMFVRLAFATMIHTDADVLIIDEALAVGDEAFQRKCFEFLASFMEAGDRVLIFVSHNIRQVERICCRTIWIDRGSIRQDGPSSVVCGEYQASIHREVSEEAGSAGTGIILTDTGEITVGHVELQRADEHALVNEVEPHSRLRITIDFSIDQPIPGLEIVVGFHTTDSVFIAGTSTAGIGETQDFEPGQHHVICEVDDMSLLPGSYRLRLAFFDRFRRPLWVGRHLCPFSVLGESARLMRIPLGLVDMPFRWSRN